MSMLTAYDYHTACTIDEAGIDMILVGDSLGNVMLGNENTLAVTVEDMIHHGKAVCRGAKNTFVVVDMPFMSYQTSVTDAVRNAGRIMKETNCDDTFARSYHLGWTRTTLGILIYVLIQFFEVFHCFIMAFHLYHCVDDQLSCTCC